MALFGDPSACGDRDDANPCSTTWCGSPLFLLVCALSLLGLRCNLFAGEEDLASAHLFRSCGPTDGPAFQILLTEKEIGCGEADGVGPWAPGSPAHVFISAYGKDAPEVPSTLVLGPDAIRERTYSEGGQAWRCDASGECVEVERGTVAFSAAPRGAPAGSVTASVALVFEDGSKISERYLVHRCVPEEPVLCG